MGRERGDEIPYWEPPMRMKEHAMETMDSHELCPDGPSEEDIRRSVTEWLEDHDHEIDAGDFFEALDPEGPFRYTGSFDPWDGIWFFVENNLDAVVDVIREWDRQYKPMDPRKGPNQ